ncbi:MerR family transcriptional regulator [Kribbella sp. NPDC056951]|uniref:MerR family transcriptional regulator n=1 Tax=Kribbella sp. NPDC056951 TaxID=3345978 RepID=UPI0036454714
MITIGQLAQYVGVSTKTIRVYHAKGLLAEPPRDASGYRRYTAQDLIQSIKIRTLTEAGVPLAKVASLTGAPAPELRSAVTGIEADLTARIDRLVAARDRLRALGSGRSPFLPADVEQHLGRLPALGFSERWVAMERDLWILTFATDPERAHQYFVDQAQAQSDPTLVALYLGCDRAYGLDPDDPALEELAQRIVQASVARYSVEELHQELAEAQLPQLVQSSVNASSPAWERLDDLIRSGVRRATAEKLRSSHATPDPQP